MHNHSRLRIMFSKIVTSVIIKIIWVIAKYYFLFFKVEYLSNSIKKNYALINKIKSPNQIDVSVTLSKLIQDSKFRKKG